MENLLDAKNRDELRQWRYGAAAGTAQKEQSVVGIEQGALPQDGTPWANGTTTAGCLKADSLNQNTQAGEVNLFFLLKRKKMTKVSFL